jgi:hypothetical protein
MSERNDTKTNQYAARVKTRSVKFEIWRIITQLPPNEYLNDRLPANLCLVVEDGVNRLIIGI